MRPPTELRTARLILRPWRQTDREPFAALNADARVMQYFPAPLSRAESDAGAARIAAHFEANGFGFWAAEVLGGTPFIGFIGLSVPAFAAHFTPCTEIGWRLAHHAWGLGYATEGARAVVRFAFETLGREEIVAMTAPANQRSRRVMEKLGMRRDPADDFDHPRIPEGHPLRRSVLYRLRP